MVPFTRVMTEDALHVAGKNGETRVGSVCQPVGGSVDNW